MQKKAKPKPSRQSAYQKRHRALGLCIYCNEPAIKLKGQSKAWICLKHIISRRENNRKRNASSRRYNAQSYALEQENQHAKKSLVKGFLQRNGKKTAKSV